MKELLGEEFQPTDVSGDFELAAKNAVEEEFPGIRYIPCLFHYAQACFRNAQIHGLSKLYDEHQEFNTWLRHIMAVPMLRHDLINAAFEDLLRQDLKLPTKADDINFARYKRYIVRQWQKNKSIPHSTLSVFECPNRTNNGCECFHAKLKLWMKVHRPSFWTFVINFNMILDFYYQQYKRCINPKKGEDGFTRGPKKLTVHNATVRSNAELGLKNGRLSWQTFLSIVSYTTKTLGDQLQKEFKAHKDQLLDDDDIDYQANDFGQDACIQCKLFIGQKVLIVECGDINICQICIDTIKASDNPVCPNVQCGKIIGATVPLVNRN